VTERDEAALRGELAGRIMGFMLSQAVYVAAKLEIADRVAEGPRSADELARKTRADADALYRLLRLLAGHGIFVEREDRSFENSDQSELLREGNGFREFALVFGELIFPAWTETLRTVETGQASFPHVFGARWEEHLAANPEANTLFNRFVAGSPGAKNPVAETIAGAGWRGGETIVDVGGGNGALLIALLERVPNVRGIVFDLPHVAAEAEERIRAAEMADCCAVVMGDFAEGLPAADAYVLSHILHGLGDAGALELLSTIRSVAPDGRVFIVDGIVAGPNEPGQKLMDLLMLVLSDGKERTEHEWRVLLAHADYELAVVHPAESWAPVLEARPVSS
jgi:SAM-dependent methyltransferase